MVKALNFMHCFQEQRLRKRFDCISFEEIKLFCDMFCCVHRIWSMFNPALRASGHSCKGRGAENAEQVSVSVKACPYRIEVVLPSKIYLSSQYVR